MDGSVERTFIVNAKPTIGVSISVWQVIPEPVNPSFGSRTLKVSMALAIEQESKASRLRNN
jgi:hypothetical protein